MIFIFTCWVKMQLNDGSYTSLMHLRWAQVQRAVKNCNGIGVNIAGVSSFVFALCSSSLFCLGFCVMGHRK